jgi:hypothetical protein
VATRDGNVAMRAPYSSTERRRRAGAGGGRAPMSGARLQYPSMMF